MRYRTVTSVQEGGGWAKGSSSGNSSTLIKNVTRRVRTKNKSRFYFSSIRLFSCYRTEVSLASQQSDANSSGWWKQEGFFWIFWERPLQGKSRDKKYGLWDINIIWRPFSLKSNRASNKSLYRLIPSLRKNYCCYMIGKLF